jgi:hypothetical protein
VIEERARERAQIEPEELARQPRERQEWEASGRKVNGPKPEPPSAEPQPGDQYNLTDPDSRIMEAGSGAHYEQAYHAQLGFVRALSAVFPGSGANLEQPVVGACRAHPGLTRRKPVNRRNLRPTGC